MIQLKIPTMMLSLNNTLAIVNKNLKRHSHALKSFSKHFVKTAAHEW